MDTTHAFNKYVKETLNHQLSHSEVDWSDLKRETTKHGPSLMEVDWRTKIKSNHTTSECMLSEGDSGAHDSSFFLYLKYIDYNGEPKDLFTQDYGVDYNKHNVPPISQSTCKTLWILDKLKMDFPTSNQSRNIEAHTLLLTLNPLKVPTLYLLGTLGRSLQPIPLQVSSLVIISKQDLWLTDITQRNQLKLLTQELFH